MIKSKCRIPNDSLLRRLQYFFRMLCKSSDSYFFATDIQKNIVMVSPNMVADFGLPGESFLDMDRYWIPLIHPDDVDKFKKSMEVMFTGESELHDCKYRVMDMKGNFIWVHCRGQMSYDRRDGVPNLFVGSITKMGFQVQADALTGLLTKNLFTSAIKAALTEPDVENPQGALMMFGIDNFKVVNEYYNRRFGDMLLQIAAKAISSVLPQGILLYKMDSDMFAMICPGMDEEGANELFRKVQLEFCHPHNIEGRSIFCTISAGTVFYPRSGKDHIILLKHAEAAIDLAKKAGKNQNCIFTKEQYNRWLRSIRTRDFLQDSVNENFAGFTLFYQPQIDARTHHIYGAEALLRWQNPKGHMVSPSEFVPILEETKMIIPVGRWIVETAVRQCKEWQKKCPGIRISINLSYEQIKEAGFKEYVFEVLKKYDVAPHLIIFELTESIVVSDWKNINEYFEDFRKLGISIAMDDFGTGYSSLEYLKNLACDIVKIDRAFVKSITEENNEFDRRLVYYTIELCHSVGIHCCIEGVEQEKEYELLRDICHADTIQGYLFGRPEIPEEFENKFFNVNNEQKGKQWVEIETK